MSNIVPQVADIQSAFPQFTDAGAIQSMLNFAAGCLDQGAWGEVWDQAITLLIGHELTLRAKAVLPNGAFEMTTGPLSSTSAGGMSASFVQMQFSAKSSREQYLSKTIYGQQLIWLWNTAIAPVWM